ncbi:MAG: lysine--tRNA ligase [Clostridium sp.]
MYEQYTELENLRNVMDDANEFNVERIKKLNELIARGINPYPYTFNADTATTYVLENFDSLSEEDSFILSGRIMLMRRMGKATFMHIRDQQGDIQIFVSKANLGEEAYGIVKLLDVGDIIGVQGNPFKTKTGEISINARVLTMLSKSIRPLPEKYHGIQDADLRQRHRSLDMIMNPEVRDRFKMRSRAMFAMREFMENQGFLEMETPILDTKYGGGEAKPFVTKVNALDCEVFMNVSPELYLKRLMVGGLDRVYSVARAFRNEGIDRTHYPEFTLMECYMAYADYNDMMELMENMYEFIFTKVKGTTKATFDGMEIDFKAPWRRATMCDLVHEHTGINVEPMEREAIVSEIRAKGLLEEAEREGFDIDNAVKGDLILMLFESYCEDKLINPTFVTDFPLDSSPLCKGHRSNPELIERFEPYAFGVELGNSYSELNNPLKQRELLADQADKLRAGLETASPMDEEFAVAIDVAMPPAGGLGVGIDRMMMFLTDSPSIREVIAFPLVKR